MTLQQLTAAMPNAKSGIARNTNFKGYTADDIVEIINRFLPEFEINTPLRIAHFLAQIAHECAEFRYTEEIASGSQYEGRLDLGNTRKGDGTKYKGRGCIQLTGRANYTAYRKYCGFDVVTQPWLLAYPTGAIRSAMWYWHTHHLNALADKDDIRTITRRINGGTNGYPSRLAYLAKAKKALGIQ